MKRYVTALVGIVLVVLGGYYLFGRAPASAPDTATTTAATATTTGSLTIYKSTTFYCAEGSFGASFGTGRVILSTSDGKVIILPRAMSGSGARYESGGMVFWNKGETAFVTENGANVYTKCIAGTRTAGPNGTYTFADDAKIFTFSYPADLPFFGDDSGYTSLWQAGGTTTGQLLAVVTIPGSFEPKTNFGDARFTIGASADPAAVASCLTPLPSEKSTVTAVTIHGIPFTKLTGTDVGAGNYYETTSYRTIYNGECYAVEYTIHSGNIENYSPDQGISAFNKTKVQNILEAMVKSFSFQK